MAKSAEDSRVRSLQQTLKSCLDDEYDRFNEALGEESLCDMSSSLLAAKLISKSLNSYNAIKDDLKNTIYI